MQISIDMRRYSAHRRLAETVCARCRMACRDVQAKKQRWTHRYLYAIYDTTFPPQDQDFTFEGLDRSVRLNKL
jgi:hypothetical protein